MVLGMTIYNTFLHSSGHVDVIGSLASVKFVMIFAVAFVIDWFFVAPLVKKIVAKLTNETTPFIKKFCLYLGSWCCSCVP